MNLELANILLVLILEILSDVYDRSAAHTNLISVIIGMATNRNFTAIPFHTSFWNIISYLFIAKGFYIKILNHF